MNRPEALVVPRPARAPIARPIPALPRVFVVTVLGVVLASVVPLVAWFRFVSSSDLHSYALLIPLISGYMVFTSDRAVPTAPALLPIFARGLLFPGVAGLVVSFVLSGSLGAAVNHVALGTSAFVLTLLGACAWFLDRATFARVAFPLGFLIFMVPLPAPALHAVETAMQHGSAAAAHALFTVSDTPVFYQSLVFELPGIALHVAPECSGIRSTLVLLVVSVVSGYFFLRSTPARAALVLLIVPLALARNGFRIFVIGFLCVRYGPQMIDSFIHRRGGPIFFALSLLPLLLALFLLQKRELRRAR